MEAGVLLLDGRLELDEALYELRLDGARVPLEPQAFDVLVHLVRHRERVVTKDELMDAVWGGRFVSETAVTSRIKQVRRALGDDGHRQQLLRTVHGRGYRFVAPVETVTSPGGAAPERTASSSPEPAPRRTPPVHYTVSDGLHIAYQVTGDASSGRDVVLISGFVSHLDLDWDDPRHVRFLDRLGSMGRLLRFDKRGTGMSDRPPGVPDLETRMHDVLAVMDAAGSERAVLVGYSEGGPMAVLMAAVHPERVAGLVLYGSYARRVWSEDYPWAQSLERRDADKRRLVDEWDWAADIRYRCPSSADEAMERWWVARMQASATPSTVAALYDMNALVDVRDVLPTLRVPTLVVHRRDDALFSIENARYLAASIPGARLVELDGIDHFVCGDPDQILDVVEPFVRQVDEPPPHMALAAVVAFSPAAEHLLERAARSGGRRRQSAGGRPVVLFDGPATAVRSGLLDETGDVGAGLAIAEVPVDSATVEGPGVDEALRLADEALGSVLVSETAAALLAASGVALEETDPAQTGARRVAPTSPAAPATTR